jgi:endonuclease/exonuclease/phosphatase family metal-dependent hydrolase
MVLSNACTSGLVNENVTIRVASYNVEFGKNATPKEIGEMFKPYNLDIIGFNEAPDGNWTKSVGKVLGMKYSYVGKTSSANHKDKYKTILSKTPLEAMAETKIIGTGWNPSSVVKATTTIRGIPIAFYSLHICASGNKKGHAYKLVTEVLPKEPIERLILVGDFNNKIGSFAMGSIEKAGMRPTWKDMKIDLSKEFTYNALNPKKNLGVIDHILYNTSSGAKATNGGIIELKKPLSDHKPIWAEIVFSKNIKK